MNTPQPPKQDAAAPGSVQPACSAAVLALQTALKKAPPLLCGMIGDTITLDCGGEYSDKSGVQRALYALIMELRQNDRTEPQPPMASVADGKDAR